jgi:hypothetical protein
MDVVEIRGTEAHALLAEGAKASVPLSVLMHTLAPPRIDTNGVVLPDGVKLAFTSGGVTILVGEVLPRIYNFQWIANDSPARFGAGTTYRSVRIALPYVIVFAVFIPGERGLPTLSKANECFFALAPLDSPELELRFPALLNCSRYEPPDGRPLSWICTQFLQRTAFEGEIDLNRRYRLAYRELGRCLFETGFNYSSEFHEASSWFTESCRADPRIATIEAWETATRGDPCFVESVPWLPVGLTVRQVAERIFKNQQATRPRAVTSATLARCIINSGSASA